MRPAAKKPKRYHGAVGLDPARVGRDAGRVADEVIAHLVGLVGAKVRVTLEIEAEVPSGTPDQVVLLEGLDDVVKRHRDGERADAKVHNSRA